MWCLPKPEARQVGQLRSQRSAVLPMTSAASSKRNCPITWCRRVATGAGTNRGGASRGELRGRATTMESEEAVALVRAEDGGGDVLGLHEFVALPWRRAAGLCYEIARPGGRG